MHYSKNKIRHSGFTLVEILIALFIFTVLSMILMGALRRVIDAQSGTEAKAERLRGLQMALLVMSRDVEQAVNRPVLTETGKQDSAFKGDETSFSLTHAGYANPAVSFAHSNMQRVRYYVEDNALWRQTWDTLDLAAETKSHVRKLLEDVETVNFEYLDGDGRSHQNWPFDKQGQQPMPRAIKMIINLSQWGKMSQLYVIPAEPSALQSVPKP